jgi:hypothetical protein
LHEFKINELLITQNAAAANVTGGVEYDYEYYDERKPDSPFVNPHDPTHQQPELLAGNLAGHLVTITFAIRIVYLYFK